MTPETRSANLNALRKAGSIYGVMLQRDQEVIYSNLPFTSDKARELSVVTDDIVCFYTQDGQVLDQLSFRYDGGNLVILLKEDHRLVVLHHSAEEVDSIAEAATSFLCDYLTGEAISSFMGSS